MKHAFVHDRLFHIGGAEAVFFDLIREKLPKCKKEHNKQTDTPPVKGVDISEQREDTSGGFKIYTLFSNRSSIIIDDTSIPIMTALPRGINNIFVRGSQQQGIIKKLFDYRNLIIFSPYLTRLLRKKILKDNPDTLTISSFAAAKNVIPPSPLTPHSSSVVSSLFNNITLYLHSPMQYIRENYDEYVKKLAAWQRWIFIPVAKHLRKRDKKPRHYDTIFTNSHYTKQCAHEYYTDVPPLTKERQEEICVRYPRIHQTILSTPASSTVLEYYVYVGRLVKFVRETDLIIKLANEFNIPLLIMGSGPDEEELKAMAGDTVQFVGQVTDVQEKITIISQSRGLINLTKESCGIGTMEALALGVPVFGYNAGATPEFVNDSNGVLAESKEVDYLGKKFREFHEKGWDREKIKKNFIEKIS